MKNHRRFAFTLIELLVVVAIIGIVATFAIPAARTMLQSSALAQASSLLSEQMSFARQHAISKNRIVEVRFYRFADPEQPGEEVDNPESGHFRAFEVFELAQGGVAIPLGKSQMLPDTIIMNPGAKLSSLIGEDYDRRVVASDDLKKTIDPELPRGVGHHYEYIRFRFLPDGTTDLPPQGIASGGKDAPSAGGKWFITIHAVNDLKKTGEKPDYDKAPPDFFTWMIDPVSGASKTFRRDI